MSDATTTPHTGSPLAGLRERLAEKERSTTVDLPLPAALEDELAVRYHALAWEKDEEIRARNGQRDDSRRKVELYMDELINACDCILYREDGAWVELTEGGSKVRFDRRLAGALGIPTGAEGGQQIDTHVVLRGVFALAAGGKSPDDAERWEQALQHADHLIDTHHTVFMAWLKGGEDLGVGAQDRIRGEALGE